MMTWVNCMIGIYFIVVVILACVCAQIKLFQENLRMSNKSVTGTTRSLLECSAVFVKNQQSLSFNYNDVDQICELSEDYPEQSSTTTEGWHVYAPIVNGEWSVWMDWGSCTETCGDGTRTRARLCNNPPASNGGIQCPGDSSQIQSCKEQRCLLDIDGKTPTSRCSIRYSKCCVDIRETPSSLLFICYAKYKESNYYVSTYKSTGEDAEAACEAMSAQLVIINDQREQQFLEELIGAMDHWIGMKCFSSINCLWIDGTPSDDGFTAWYPGEPDGKTCVWVGYLGPYWDDMWCYNHHYFICEYL